jgi:hypothetical protein
LALCALIVELAEKHRLPVIYPSRDYVELSGLMAYAPDSLAHFSQRTVVIAPRLQSTCDAELPNSIRTIKTDCPLGQRKQFVRSFDKARSLIEDSPLEYRIRQPRSSGQKADGRLNPQLGNARCMPIDGAVRDARRIRAYFVMRVWLNQCFERQH